MMELLIQIQISYVTIDQQYCSAAQKIDVLNIIFCLCSLSHHFKS